MSHEAPGRGGIDEEIAERVTDLYRLVRKFSRLEVEGLENVPDGKALIVANHTGWAGWDFANLYVVLRDDLEREVYTAMHPNWFRLDRVSDLVRRVGGFEAGVTESMRILDRDNLVMFFPEGEAGNFKPYHKRYELQEFRPGFARVASASMAPIVPVLIVGGEEAHPVWKRLEFTKELLGVGLPIPASLLPLPVKWRIEILPPIDPEKYMTADKADADPVEDMRRDVEELMRSEIERVLDERGHPFL